MIWIFAVFSNTDPGAVTIILDAVVQNFGLQLGLGESWSQKRWLHFDCVRGSPSTHVPERKTQHFIAKVTAVETDTQTDRLERC